LLFFSCDLFNNQNTATLIFKGVEKFPILLYKTAPQQVTADSANTYLMYSRDMEFDIKEIWISEGIVSANTIFTGDWYLLGESEGLKSMSEYEFIAEDIPEGTYASLMIVFRNNVLRHAVFVSDTSLMVDMAGSLNEGDTSDMSLLIQYFSPDGSFYADSLGYARLMAAGESFASFELNAGHTSTIYWKGGGPESVWTDFTFQWHDYDGDGAWTPTVDLVNNFDGPEDVPMWSFLIVEE
jgi:hypothetical protein